MVGKLNAHVGTGEEVAAVIYKLGPSYHGLADYLEANGYDAWPETARIGYVRRLRVDPNWRGRGVGSRLLDAAIESMRGAKVRQVFLHVVPEDRQRQQDLLAFYGRYGFGDYNVDDGERVLWRDLRARVDRRPNPTLSPLPIGRRMRVDALTRHALRWDCSGALLLHALATTVLRVLEARESRGCFVTFDDVFGAALRSVQRYARHESTGGEVESYALDVARAAQERSWSEDCVRGADLSSSVKGVFTVLDYLAARAAGPYVPMEEAPNDATGMRAAAPIDVLTGLTLASVAKASAALAALDPAPSKAALRAADHRVGMWFRDALAHPTSDSGEDRAR